VEDSVKLTDLIDRRTVETALTAQTMEESLRALVDRMVEAGIVNDRDDVVRRLVEREQVMSTGIGGGIAIPHARTPEVSRTMVAVGLSRDGVPFNAVDGEPVKAVFLIVGPLEASAEHVKVLARIARVVKSPEFLEQAGQAETAEEFLSLVEQLE
jgi:mannitol/fructose-specific phosphotransferase system IIA component (Ntr-type)